MEIIKSDINESTGTPKEYLSHKSDNYIIWSGKFLNKPNILIRLDPFDYYGNVQASSNPFMDKLAKIKKADYSDKELDLLKDILVYLKDNGIYQTKEYVIINDEGKIENKRISTLISYTIIRGIFLIREHSHTRYLANRLFKKLWLKEDASKYCSGIAHGGGNWLRANAVGVAYSFDFINKNSKLNDILAKNS